MEHLKVEIIEHVDGVATGVPSLHKTQRYGTELLQHAFHLLLLTVLPDLPQRHLPWKGRGSLAEVAINNSRQAVSGPSVMHKYFSLILRTFHSHHSLFKIIALIQGCTEVVTVSMMGV